MRVLIAFEATHASYASALAETLRIRRPGQEVRVVGLRELRADVSRFSPHLVISSQPADSLRNYRAAWFRLSVDPARLSEARLDGTARAFTNPDLDEVIAVVDATAALVRAGHLPRRPGNA